MKIIALKPLVFSLPLLLGCILAQQAQAVDNDAAVKSLDSITSQSSEIPSLLMDKSISLPEAESIPSPKPKSAPKHKSAGYRLQTSQAQTDEMNAQLSELKAAQEKRIDELTKQYASTQDASAKALEAQQNKLAESEQQQADLQTKWQSATQQLESANKRIAELSASRPGQGTQTVQLKQSLTESQNQVDALTEKVAELTAQQQKLTDSEKQQAELQTKWQSATQQLESANKRIAELSAARLDEGTEIAQLKQSLTESQNQADTLTKNVAGLTAKQQKSADAEKQRIELQTKWQSTSQQLESANKRIAELTAARLDEGQETLQLKQTLSDSQDESAALAKKITALTTEQAAKVSELAAMKKSLEESDGKRTELQTKWQEATTNLEAQTKQMASLKGSSSTPAPVSKEEIRAYALGAFWGHDVLNAMKNVEADGFKVSQPQVISGVTDMMSGKFKIPEEKMMAELQEMDTSATAKAPPPTPTNDNSNSYIAKYSKKPGVKKEKMGYYYRITEKGRGAIKSTDTVAIAVTESLSNGKVIKDMTKSGKVLVLPLDRFPPLFKTAITKMNNHGKLQMVVPPELAYGEAGSPPNIPPNATMVYDVNIVNVNPGK